MTCRISPGMGSSVMSEVFAFSSKRWMKRFFRSNKTMPTAKVSVLRVEFSRLHFGNIRQGLIEARTRKEAPHTLDLNQGTQLTSGSLLPADQGIAIGGADPQTRTGLGCRKLLVPALTSVRLTLFGKESL